jgi:hypothetical protein
MYPALNYHPDFDDAMACPWCGEGYLHVDRVGIAARQEDRPPTTIDVNAVTGTITVGDATVNQIGDTGFWNQRRHWIELHTNCEMCDGGVITLAQHKGQTRLILHPTIAEGNDK